MQQKYSRIMEESAGNIFCAEIGERVSLEEYQELFEPVMRDIIAQQKGMRILLSYTQPFLGWDLNAAALDLACMTKAARYFEKVALINPPEPVLLRWQALKPLLGGQLRFFTNAQFDEALNWVKA